jgi:hypothetical protein
VDSSSNQQQGRRDSKSVVWTLQQFCTVAGRPWFALQQQTDEGVIWQATGYRQELDELCTRQGITPDELPPTTEEEFLKRASGNFPEPQP